MESLLSRAQKTSRASRLRKFAESVGSMTNGWAWSCQPLHDLANVRLHPRLQGAGSLGKSVEYCAIDMEMANLQRLFRSGVRDGRSSLGLMRMPLNVHVSHFL